MDWVEESAPRLRAAVRRRERLFVLLVLGACLAAAVLLPAALGLLEGRVDAADSRWAARLEACQALMENGRYEEAAGALELLDRQHPARQVKHARYLERQHVMAALAECDLALDRKRRTLETLRALVAFDPRSFENHFRLAEAARHFGELDEAREQYLAVLEVHPSHLPSAEGAARIAFDGGRFADVTAVFETYLEGFWIQHVRVSAGEASVDLKLPVDGRTHVLEGWLSREPGWKGDLVVEPGGFPLEVTAFSLAAPLRVGVEESTGEQAVAPERFVLQGCERTPEGVFLPSTQAPRWRAPLELPAGATRLRVEARAFRPVTPELWEMVETSYRNQLRSADLEAARARCFVRESGP